MGHAGMMQWREMGHAPSGHGTGAGLAREWAGIVGVGGASVPAGPVPSPGINGRGLRVSAPIPSPSLALGEGVELGTLELGGVVALGSWWHLWRETGDVGVLWLYGWGAAEPV